MCEWLATVGYPHRAADATMGSREVNPGSLDETVDRLEALQARGASSFIAYASGLLS